MLYYLDHKQIELIRTQRINFFNSKSEIFSLFNELSTDLRNESLMQGLTQQVIKKNSNLKILADFINTSEQTLETLEELHDDTNWNNVDDIDNTQLILSELSKRALDYMEKAAAAKNKEGFVIAKKTLEMLLELQQLVRFITISDPEYPPVTIHETNNYKIIN